MKRTLKVLVLLLLPLFSNQVISQSCFDEIAENIIPETSYKLEKNSEIRREFLESVNCFLGPELDTIDIEILTENSYLTVILVVDQIFNDDAITYRKLKELFIDFVTDPSYEKIRELHLLTRDFSLRPAIYENWDRDKQLLIDLGIPEDRLKPFKKYLKDNSNTGMTYQELMMKFEESKARRTENMEE